MIANPQKIQIKAIPANRLTAAQVSAWSRLQESNAEFSSPYFRPEFTQAVAAVRSDVEVGVLERAGEPVGFFPFQRGRFHIGKPVGGRLSDFHGAVVDETVDWTAAELLAGCFLRAWDFTHVPASQTNFAQSALVIEDSPFIDLSDGYDAYVALRRAGGSGELKRIPRKFRKIEREIGTLRLERQSADPKLLGRLMEWKSQQYRRTGLADVFSFRWTRRLLERLLTQNGEHFRGVLSALYAGENLIALHFGMQSRGVLHYWFPGYDARFEKYSPGLLLLLEIAKSAGEFSLTRIDLGKGDEHFKKSLMTGATPIASGSVETDPLLRTVRQSWKQTRDWMKSSPLGAPARLSARLVNPLREWLTFQ